MLPPVSTWNRTGSGALPPGSVTMTNSRLPATSMGTLSGPAQSWVHASATSVTTLEAFRETGAGDGALAGGVEPHAIMNTRTLLRAVRMVVGYGGVSAS